MYHNSFVPFFTWFVHIFVLNEKVATKKGNRHAFYWSAFTSDYTSMMWNCFELLLRFTSFQICSNVQSCANVWALLATPCDKVQSHGP